MRQSYGGLWLKRGDSTFKGQIDAGHKTNKGCVPCIPSIWMMEAPLCDDAKYAVMGVGLGDFSMPLPCSDAHPEQHVPYPGLEVWPYGVDGVGTERFVAPRGAVAMDQNLAVAQMLRSGAEREAAERARTVAALAHDLMQPLLGVRLHLACALSDAPAEMIGTLRTAIASLLSAEHLVETLMESATLDVDGIAATFSAVDLQEVVGLVCEEASAVAWIRLLDLRYRANRSLTVRTDQMLVTRIIRNLVSNAVRYSERGKVLVGLRIRDGLPVVEVWDTGMGFEPAVLATYLAEGTLDNVPARGMGIGLQTVARLVDALGLTLDARSVPGHGTVFRLIFPDPASLDAIARL